MSLSAYPTFIFGYRKLLIKGTRKAKGTRIKRVRAVYVCVLHMKPVQYVTMARRLLPLVDHVDHTRFRVLHAKHALRGTRKRKNGARFTRLLLAVFAPHVNHAFIGVRKTKKGHFFTVLASRKGRPFHATGVFAFPGRHVDHAALGVLGAVPPPVRAFHAEPRKLQAAPLHAPPAAQIDHALLRVPSAKHGFSSDQAERGAGLTPLPRTPSIFFQEDHPLLGVGRAKLAPPATFRPVSCLPAAVLVAAELFSNVDHAGLGVVAAKFSLARAHHGMRSVQGAPLHAASFAGGYHHCEPFLL